MPQKRADAKRGSEDHAACKELPKFVVSSTWDGADLIGSSTPMPVRYNLPWGLHLDGVLHVGWGSGDVQRRAAAVL